MNQGGKNDQRPGSTGGYAGQQPVNGAANPQQPSYPTYGYTMGGVSPYPQPNYAPYGQAPQVPNPTQTGAPNTFGAYPNQPTQPQNKQENEAGAYAGYQPTSKIGYSGYQPGATPKPAPSRWDIPVMIVLFGLLPVLFILSMVLPGMSFLKWVFTGLALATVGLIWWKREAAADSIRYTFTGVYAALVAVVLLTTFTGMTVDVKNPEASSTGAEGSDAAQSAPGESGESLGPLLEVTQDPFYGAPTPTPDLRTIAGMAAERMESFFYAWSMNSQDNMIALCSPSWASGLKRSAAEELFSILANRTPTEWEMEKITGTDSDSTRTITVTALIQRHNNKEPAKYRFQLMMVKENEQWYVDPRSLESHVKETPTPTPGLSTATPIPPATPHPALVLYYNPDGGQQYHTDPNCRSLADRVKPLTNSFYYSDLGNATYSELSPCSVCGAPYLEKT